MTEILYSEGSIVYAKVNPGLRLKVRRYLDRIYYCIVPAQPAHKELAYFERELTADAAVAGNLPHSNGA
ncbi:hypothetical protein ACFS7Z_16450 [Pontibacter toksunensis]|uniref:Uncharacterized protein n=1 Tax=Pontibacter toksunensis TaxID=1332631 RepID=A0ABW6BVV9_9BACT